MARRKLQLLKRDTKWNLTTDSVAAVVVVVVVVLVVALVVISVLGGDGLNGQKRGAVTADE